MEPVLDRREWLQRDSFHRMAESRLASAVVLIALFWMAASASFSGFVGKWGLEDNTERYGIELMFDATAHKPFVYRQLAPKLASLVDHFTPEAVRHYVTAKIKPEETFARVTALKKPELRFRYLIVYYMSFLSLFFSLFVLRNIAIDAGVSNIAAVVAPLSLALAFPYLQTVGGFFYDSIELLFLSLAFLMASRGRALFLLALVLPATLNKETFIFFIPTLYPLLQLNGSKRRSMVLLMGAVLTAGVLNTLIKLAFADSPGGVAEFHLLENLKNHLWPVTYAQLEVTYGVIGPGGAFVGTIALIVIIVIRGWHGCSTATKRHLLIASAINLPLVLALSATGELRNLSLVFVGFVIVVAHAVDREVSLIRFGGRVNYAA
jgi:hypothetical protein